MKNGIEIRWHGRGGQGAKTAALLLADVAFKTGKHVQGFVYIPIFMIRILLQLLMRHYYIPLM